MAKAKDEDPAARPVTAEERAESRAIARAHISACRAALIAAGIRRAPPRRKHGKAERAEGTGDEARGPADGEKALAAIAQGLTRHCRRGDCRRAFTCRFGTRRGESETIAPPCLERLPQEAVLALRLGAMRLRTPEAFREARLVKFEAGVIRQRAAEAAALTGAKDGGGMA
ncbi:hypothetical protein [Jiella pacifica]|uniref:Uncharacterized protein n=1 Tax=Jiella pacifica TaxID=2696469 RepID=A0A6N9TCA8_9HYPH|nr:hypothetical protein [Jiella pacifica]NDW06518.1 hypothetical protein [Jiella pacifica]